MTNWSRSQFAQRSIWVLERIRLVLVFIGFYRAFSNPLHAAHYLLWWLVIPLNFLCALEVCCFTAASAYYKGRKPSVYQWQSACYQFALALTAFAVWYVDAAVAAAQALIFVTVFFFFCSGIVHLLEFIQHKLMINLWRFVGASIMFVATCYVLWVL